MHAKYGANPCLERLFRDQLTFVFIYFATIRLGLSALRAPTVGPLKSYNLNQSPAAKEELSKQKKTDAWIRSLCNSTVTFWGEHDICEYIDVFMFICCCICYPYAYL